MTRKKQLEEKQMHGSADLPVGVHKMTYPPGTDVIFYLHWHPEFELLVLTEGTIRFTIEDREYILKQGEGVFINANLLHSAWSLEEKGCSFIAVDFLFDFLHEDMHSRFAKKYIKPVLDGKVVFPELISAQRPDCYGRQEFDGVSLHTPEDAFVPERQEVWQMRLLYLIQELWICQEHDIDPFELLLRSHILGAWNLLERHSIRIKKGSLEDLRATERLEPVVRYMKENYSDEISLGERAKLIPMSEGQFCRVFKQSMKMSPMQYLMRYRILQSCKLLQDTDKKVSEIANLSGFNNISYFNKVFLQTIGCTPKQYRANSTY